MGKAYVLPFLTVGFPMVNTNPVFLSISARINRIVKTYDFIKKKEFVYYGKQAWRDDNGLCRW